MKIAILLTGNLRSFDFTKNIQKKLLDTYDTHYFLSIDVDNSLQREYYNSIISTDTNMVEKAINFFNPKKFIVINDFEDKFINNKNKFDKEITINKRENISYYKRPLRQYYCVKNAYKLLIDYITETNTAFDIIVRLRFDQYIWDDNTANVLPQLIENKCGIVYENERYCKTQNEDNNITTNHILDNKKISFSECFDNYIYLFGSGIYHNNNTNKKHEVTQNFYANDQFWYHNTSLIHKMYNFYDEIVDLIIYRFKNNIFIYNTSTENLFYNFLINNNINIGKSNIKGLFVREHSKFTK